MPLCGHPPATVLSYASCTGVLAQLMRITEPAAWEPGSLGRVPFEVADDCDPGPDNTYVVYSGDYCGWECRNSACLLAVSDLSGLGALGGGVVGGLLPAYTVGGVGGMRGPCAMLGGADDGSGGGGGGAVHGSMVMGMPGARYGSERLGIGWRTA